MQENIKHWSAARLTAMLLALLFIYFISQIEYLTRKSRMEFIGWVKEPVTTGALLLFIICAFWHACLGVEEIITDYIQSKNLQTLSFWINKLFFFVLGAACFYAVLAISFGKF